MNLSFYPDDFKFQVFPSHQDRKTKSDLLTLKFKPKPVDITNKRICFFYPDSPNFNFKFQICPDCQDRKTNLSVRFLGEVMARQFCFEIY